MIPPCTSTVVETSRRWMSLGGRLSAWTVLGTLLVAPVGPTDVFRAQTSPPRGGKQDVRVDTIVYGEAPADSAPGGTRELRLDLYRVDTDSVSRGLPGIILLHGGGFVGGRRDLTENRELGRALASRGYVVASIDYRLWGDRPVVSPWARKLGRRVSDLGLPPVERMEDEYGPEWTVSIGAAAEDALRALRWMRGHGSDLGLDPDRIALGGMSAGALTAVELAYRLERYGVDVPPISAIVAVRGSWLFASPEEADPVDPGGPPLFMVHGTEDRRVPFAEAIRLFDAARAAGVPVEFHPLAGIDHDDREIGGRGMLRVRLDDGSYLVDRLDRFLTAAFNSPDALEPSVCLGSGDACPDGTVSDALAGRELSPRVQDVVHDRVKALIVSVETEPAFVEELLGYSRAEELRHGFLEEARLDWSYWPSPRSGLESHPLRSHPTGPEWSCCARQAIVVPSMLSSLHGLRAGPEPDSVAPCSFTS